MADDWWADAPLVQGSSSAPNWWDSSPIVGQSAPTSTPAPGSPAAMLSPDKLAKQRAIDAGNDPDKIMAQEAQARNDAYKNDEIGGLSRAATQGMSFGFGDELAAGARSAISGQPYDEALADERERLNAFRSAHPYQAYGTEIGAGLLTPVGVAGDALKGGVTAGKLLKTGVTAGGIPGAVYGFGSGEGGLANRATNALESGAIGTAVGAGAPLVVHGLKGAASAFTDALGNVINPSAAARRAIVDAADQSGLPLDQIATHMGAGPENSAVPFNLVDAAKAAADAQGRPGAAIPFTNLARNAGGHGGEAEAAASEALQGRQMNQGDRLADTFDNAVNGANYGDEVNRLQSVIDNDARQAFGRAHANAQAYDIQGPLANYAQRNAEQLSMRGQIGEEMNRALGLFYERGANGADGPIITTLPQFQAAKQNLDQMIQRSMNAGEPTPLTRQLSQLRSVVDNAVKRTNPDYATADRLYSGARTSQDLLNMGASAIMRSGNAQRDLLQRFPNMTPAQQDLIRIGVMQKMKDQVANLMTGSVSTARQFDKDSLRQFLTQILPPDRARTLLSEINREATSTRTMSDVFGNSRTAPMQEGMAKLAEDAGIAGHAMTLNAPGVARGIGAKIGRQFVGQKNNALMQNLMSTDPQATQNAMRQLQQDVQARIRGARQYQDIMSALIGSSARTAVQEKPKNQQ